MSSVFIKEAVLAKLLAAIKHPNNRVARDAFELEARSALQRSVNAPIKRGLERAKVDKGVGRLTEALATDVPGTPRLFMKHRTAPERAALGRTTGAGVVSFISENPEFLPTLPFPVPGLTPALLGAKRGLRKALNVPTATKTKVARLSGLSDELMKLSAEQLKSINELKEKLQPGDILYTKPRDVKGLAMKAFYKVESAYQRSPYTHVGMYVGDGKIVDAGSWKGKGADPTAVHKVGLKEFTDRYDFKVLRVAAPEKAKTDAVAFAKQQIGKDFNMKGLARLVAPFKGRAGKERPRKSVIDSMFCSELVVNAYAPHKNIAKTKKLEHVLPGDIFKSPHTKTVAEYSKGK